jgi:hypothetical protein
MAAMSFLFWKKQTVQALEVTLDDDLQGILALNSQLSKKE